MPEHKSLYHGSTVVVCSTEPELCYILRWAEKIGKTVPAFMYNTRTYPFYVSVSGDTVGWTGLPDRALYYKPFLEYVAEISA